MGMPSRILCTLALLTLTGCGASTEAPDVKNLQTENASVIHITDGDTVIVEMSNGTQETIRIIGIDTPEMRGGQSKGPECFAKEATNALLQLIDGANVTLVSDPSSDRDSYERLLRYIHVDNIDVGAHMISEGFAGHFPWFDHARKDSYTTLHTKAKKQRKGLWKECEVTEGEGREL